MAEKYRDDEKPDVIATDEHSRIEPPPQDQESPNDDSRKRHFDVDRIIERTSQVQAHLKRSIEFGRLSEALGTCDTDFVWGLTQQIMEAVNDHQSGDAIGFVLSVIRDDRPRDHSERMLAAQKAVAHLKFMRVADGLTPTIMLSDPEKAGFLLNAMTKFGRLFAAEMMTLKQYRSGGEQRVTVRHVSVSDNGQAIVGNVSNQRVIEDPQNASPKLTDARQEAMEPIPQQDPIPVRAKRSNE